MSDTRPVWLTREQTNAISRLLVDYDQRGIWNPALTVPIGDILVAWDAAPTDATEAVRAQLAWRHRTAEDVLRALRMPEAGGGS